MLTVFSGRSRVCVCVWTYPMISVYIVGCDAEAVEASAPENQLWNNENHSELWLVDAVVPSREKLNAWIRDQSS